METSFLQTQLRPAPNTDSASLGTPDPYGACPAHPPPPTLTIASAHLSSAPSVYPCGLSDITYYARLAVLHILTRQVFRLFKPRFVQINNAHFSPLRQPVRHLHNLHSRALAVGARRLNAMIYRIPALRRVLGASFYTSPRLARHDSKDIDPWRFCV
ncbi:hypothetical protein B0H13DRAFT_2000601, partial [Mycena leptocephala]